MAINTNNKKNSNSETVPFNVSKLSTLQYIKVVYVGADNELYEIGTEVLTLNNDMIHLFLNTQKEVNITCPTGIVLKLVTGDAIYFAKAILKEIRKVNNRILFCMDAPKKTIRQQNRKHCRINLDCSGVILVNDGKSTNQPYLIQTINISMGGVLLYNVESMLNDDKITLQLRKNDSCHIVLFIEQNFMVKSSAQFVRLEYIDNMYRYAFQFQDMPRKYINPLNKYITNEQLKLLKANSIKTSNKKI
jgi:c-di-GMP-binding flagellar brake protein YcgR